MLSYLHTDLEVILDSVLWPTFSENTMLLR